MKIFHPAKSIFPFLLAFVIGLTSVWFFTIFSSPDVQPVKIPLYETGSGYAACSGKSSDNDVRETLDQDRTKLRIVSKPRPQYTDLARQNNTQGTVVLRVTFLASGNIGSVNTVKELPDGLTEEAIEAARRIKFKPVIKDGQPVSITRSVEYTFSIY